jgi:polysaccharide export outer membrane protein
MSSTVTPRIRTFSQSWARTIALIALATGFSATNACADYRLSVGDVVEIAAVGLPDFKQRATIGPDGEVSLPLLGQMPAAGMLLSELRAKVHSVLPSKMLLRRTPEGREYPVVIAPEEVTLTVVEYRPIYLNGDVARPGEQPYRPGMTVRQAVSLAGGYDVMRFRMNNPLLEAADLKGEYESLWAEAVKEQAQIARFKAELNNQTEFDRTSLTKGPIAPTTMSDILNLEQAQLTARNEDHKKENIHLREAIRQEDSRIALLSQQLQKEEEGRQEDILEFERLKELFQKGQIPIMRVADSRRLVLLSSTRALQTSVGLASLERERQELERKLQKAGDQRRIDLLRELETSEVRLSSARARLSALSEKLLYAGIIKSQLVRGDGAEPDLIIYRRDREGLQKIEAQQDSDLQPGDVIEIALRPAGLGHLTSK